MTIASINPATGETIEIFEPHGEAEIERRLALALECFLNWRSVPLSDRAVPMRRAAGILEDRKEHWARIMSLEMGKPIRAAVAETEKCALVCRYYADNAAQILAEERIGTDATDSYIRYEPLGPVLAVMPWNFPFWQVFRFAAPALMAGNVGLLKHASNVPGCALAIEEVFRDAGFPDGAFQTLLIGSPRVGGLIEDDRVRAVTLTGSEAAGESVGAAAGAQIKKAVLELGGSDPFIVMPGADLDAAVSTAVTARTINNGQSCIAAKRFILHDAIAGEFEARFAERMGALKVGDPLDPRTDIGPLATPSILEEVDRLVRDTVAAGARLVLGGKPLDRPGNFYPPSVLADVPHDTPAAVEEVFGPVASLFRVPDLDAAIRLANGTRFGLGASAWTQDEAERSRLIQEIEAGAVFINGLVKSDPRLPFGGIKRSGFGRELASQGMREFLNVKTVWIR